MRKLQPPPPLLSDTGLGMLPSAEEGRQTAGVEVKVELESRAPSEGTTAGVRPRPLEGAIGNGIDIGNDMRRSNGRDGWPQDVYEYTIWIIKRRNRTRLLFSACSFN